MIYIQTALKSEAQAIVEKFKLKKFIINSYTTFKNGNIILIISGIGVQNTKKAISNLTNNFDIKVDDTILNIGICGANEKFEISQLIQISAISYKNKLVKLNNATKNTITCLDYECSENQYDIVDMESFGFYEATKEMKNVKIFKVVSDHFNPQDVSKEKTKLLISSSIEEIIKHI